MPDWMTLGLVLAVSTMMTGLLRRYALKRSLLDVPNSRSSHSAPTPRGGGVAIVITFLAGSALLFFLGRIASEPFMALFCGGLLVAAVGFWDDHGHVSARWRILVHFAAAAWALYWLGGFPAVPIGDEHWDLGWFGHMLGILLVVWWLNLFNFMDGIDGIAGIEAIFVAGGAALILLLSGIEAPSFWLALLAVGCLGFLAWNWPPARIFMGDVGSGFLGFILGGFAVMTAATGALPVWTWLILFGVFLVDATVTLLRRVLRRDRWYEAHRSHAYQQLARSLRSHKKVTLGVLLIDVVWLLPLAWLAAWRPDLGWILTVCALTPLVIVVLKLGAGRSEEAPG